MTKRFTKKIFISVLFLTFICSVLTFAYTTYRSHCKFPFYVYSSYGDSKKFHFYASGRIGDAQSIRLFGNCRENPLTKKSCIKIIYTVSSTTRSHLGWAGLYWLEPANNWGLTPEGGYDLSGAKRCVFHARGKKGGEKITFKIGGVPGLYGDTAEAFLPLVTLTDKWQRYEIPLEKSNLSRVVGGFCWTANRLDNPEGATFYLDEIYYEQ
ncbi:MAG: hypothetical protein JW928_08200 [Candidatus Aureabacteria bacterium]|nr:hypothetical protein [Candidatus Auribacterota bacterium]